MDLANVRGQCAYNSDMHAIVLVLCALAVGSKHVLTAARTGCTALPDWSSVFASVCEIPQASRGCPLAHARQNVMPEAPFWILMAGDSLLRGEFVQIVHEVVSDLSWPPLQIVREFNRTTYPTDHLFCCISSDIPRKCMLVRVGLEVRGLLSTVAKAMLHGYSCVTWSWLPLFANFYVFLKKLNTSIVVPNVVIFNQGLHQIQHGWDQETRWPHRLHDSLTYIHTLQQTWGTVCLYHSITWFDPSRVPARKNLRSTKADSYRFLMNKVMNKNAVPVIPTYEISRLRVVAATIQTDGVHYGAEYRRRVALADIQWMSKQAKNLSHLCLST